MHQRSRSARLPAAPKPFWTRLRSFPLYPLRGTALITLVTLTLCPLSRMVPGIGWLLSLLTWGAIYAYAFDILRHTADGRMQAPEILQDSRDGTVWRLFAMMIALVVIVVLAFGAGGLIVGMIVLVAVVLLQPGFVISLAMDGSL